MIYRKKSGWKTLRHGIVLNGDKRGQNANTIQGEKLSIGKIKRYLSIKVLSFLIRIKRFLAKQK